MSTTTIGACRQITAFVDVLSNWYVRRSRDRFWSSDKQAQEKLDAYWTLYECLATTTKMVAPFVPFVAESIWQNLTGVFDGEAVASVHLCDYPTPDPVENRPDPVAANELASRNRLLGTIGPNGGQAESSSATFGSDRHLDRCNRSALAGSP